MTSLGIMGLHLGTSARITGEIKLDGEEIKILRESDILAKIVK